MRLIESAFPEECIQRTAAYYPVLVLRQYLPYTIITGKGKRCAQTFAAPFAGPSGFRSCVSYGIVVPMSVRMRHTSSHTKNRRSHHALTAASIMKDKESGALRLPHRLDESTGMYRGKQVLPKKEMKSKAEHGKKIEKEKREHEHAHAEGAKQPMHSEKESKTQEKKTGMLGRLTKGRAKARSGMGGGA